MAHVLFVPTVVVGSDALQRTPQFTHYMFTASIDAEAPVVIIMPGAGTAPTGRKPIAKNLTTDIPITIDGMEGTVADVQVALYLVHSDTSQITLALIHPDNTAITLASNIAGANYGTGAEPVIFDDSASVVVGPTHKKGKVRPSTLLAAFKGKSPNGTWKLRIINNSGIYDGSLEAGTLFVGSSAPGGGRKTVGQLWPRGNK